MKLYSLNKSIILMFFGLLFSVHVLNAQNTISENISKKTSQYNSNITTVNYGSSRDGLGRWALDSDGNFYLGGKYIEFGIGKDMNSNTVDPVPVPTGFYGREYKEGKKGISAGAFLSDNDGFGVGEDLRVDYFLPGNPDETFTISAKNEDGSSVIDFDSDYEFSDIFGGVVNNYLELSSRLKVYPAGNDSEYLGITHQIGFGVFDRYVRYDVEIYNKTSSNLDIVYERSFNPDNDGDLNGDPNTNNTIISGAKDFDVNGFMKVIAKSLKESDIPGNYYSLTGSTSEVYYYSRQNNVKPFFERKGRDEPYYETNSNYVGDFVEVGIHANQDNILPGEKVNFTFYIGMTSTDGFVTVGENLIYQLTKQDVDLFDPEVEVDMITIYTLPDPSLGSLYYKGNLVSDISQVENVSISDISYLAADGSSSREERATIQYKCVSCGDNSEKTLHFNVLPTLYVDMEISDRIYDGTVNIYPNQYDLSNLTIEDKNGNLVTDVTFDTSRAVLNYDDKDVYVNNGIVSDKDVLVSGLVLTGENSQKYFTKTTFKGKITQRKITVNASVIDKVYDGNTSVILDILGISENGVQDPNLVFSSVPGVDNSGYVVDDNLELIDLEKTYFTQKDVKYINDTIANISIVSEMNIDGGDAHNYKFIPRFLSAKITPIKLTLNPDPDTGLVFDPITKEYNGKTGVEIGGGTLIGILPGEDVSLPTTIPGSFDDKNVGVDKPVTYELGLKGNDKGNYEIEKPVLIGEITAKPITVIDAEAVDKYFDRTTKAKITDAKLNPEQIVDGDNDGLYLDNADVGEFEQSDVLYTDEVEVADMTVYTNFVLAGIEKDNYTLIPFGNLKAKILPSPVVITLVDEVFEWDNKPKYSTVTVDDEDAVLVIKYYLNDEEVTKPTDLGVYKVVVTVTDPNYKAVREATLNIQDTTPPVITLESDQIIVLDFDMPCNDMGAVSIDNYDGIIFTEIDSTQWQQGNLPGDYIITYNATDSSGNKAETVTQTIRVVWGDKDNDGIPDNEEDLGRDGDPTNDDNDNDGLPNYNDPDDDDDTIPTKDEKDKDSDGDGDENHLDPDDDDDGIPTWQEAPIGDTDNDGKPNYLDIDDDGDGVPSRYEMGEVVYNNDGDRIPDGPDSNGDGIVDYQNTDGDDKEDYLDTDDDNDSVLTRTELGDVEFDDDNVAIVDDKNEDSKPEYLNTDNDQWHNYLDVDDDGDMIKTIVERTNLDGSLSNIDTDLCGNYNYLDKDDDEDGLSTLEELGINVDQITELSRVNHFTNLGDVMFYHKQLDLNNDGIISINELKNTDGDIKANYIDNDDDNDGVLTSNELGKDTDNDGLLDIFDIDDDNDGIPTIEEFMLDTDKDGIQNNLENDDDNDGVLTIKEKDLNEDCDIDSLDHLDAIFTPANFIINAPETVCEASETILELWGELGRAKTIQWQFKGVDIPYANGDKYIIENTELFHEGQYTVVITDYCGNTFTESKYISVGSSKEIMEMWSDVLAVDNTEGNFIAFQWYLNNEIIKGAENQYYNRPEGIEGWFSVLLTYQDGTQRQTCPVYYGSLSKKSDYSLRLYPNPTTGNTNTYLEIFDNDVLYKQASRVDVYNIQGQKVYEGNSSTGKCIINTQTFKSGIYLVRVLLGDGTLLTDKILIQ